MVQTTDNVLHSSIFFVYRQCTVLYFLYEQYLYMQQHDTAFTMYIPCILHSRNSLYSVYCTLYRYLYFVLLWTISVYSLWDTKVLSCTQSVQWTLYRFWYFFYILSAYMYLTGCWLLVLRGGFLILTLVKVGWVFARNNCCQFVLKYLLKSIKLRPRAKHYQYFIMHTRFY